MKAAELLGFGFALVVGWTDPEGARPRLGALLLAYYDPDGRLIYAGRAGTGIDHAGLERLWRRLQPVATSKMPLDVPPPGAGVTTALGGSRPDTFGAGASDAGRSATSPGITTTDTPRLPTACRIATSRVRGIWLALEISSQ